MTLLEMTLKSPGFKAFCRRRINGHSLTHAERLKLANKRFCAEFRAFCKRRGMLSILKDNEYQTGASTGYESVRARIFKQAGEFNSEILNQPCEISRDASNESEAA